MNRLLDRLSLSEWEEIEDAKLIHHEFPLTDQESQLLEQAGLIKASKAILTIGLPVNYDSGDLKKVLFSSVTSDIYMPNAYSCRKYWSVSQQTDWILMSVDSVPWPVRDSVIVRMILFGSAIRYLGEQGWPTDSMKMAFAGFSGGSKASIFLSLFSSKIGVPLIGLFLGGCNDAHLKLAEETTGVPISAITDTPVFFSIGLKDRIASPKKSKLVAKKMKKAGFDRQNIQTHQGGHVFDKGHLAEALAFFEANL